MALPAGTTTSRERRIRQTSIAPPTNWALTVSFFIFNPAIVTVEVLDTFIMHSILGQSLPRFCDYSHFAL
jgi:hypothetical protein